MAPPTRPAGQLDDGNSGYLTGWAFDPGRPGEAAEVELRVSTGDVARVRAGECREELAGQGIDGRHGFRVKLPAAAFNGPVIVSARHAATGEPLAGSPRHLRPPAIDLLAGDVVDNCNLRCPFCLVDYANIRGLRQMTMDTYRRMVAVMPIVADGMAWLSCLHEPTLNASLVEMIEATPGHLRRKLSFTTNLCKKLDDRTLAALAGSGIHHIRISYDTRDPELFGRLRKGGVYAQFLDNLQRLVARRASASPPVPLGFVTVALRDNWREIPDLVRACAELCQPSYHDVRCLYYQPHLAEWGKEHALALADWNELKRRLQDMPPATRLEFGEPDAGALERFEKGEREPGYSSGRIAIGGDYDEPPLPMPDAMTLGASLANEPLQLRLRWDGLIVRIPGDVPLVNLHQLDDPISFFRTIRSAAPPSAGDVWNQAPAR